MSFEEWVEDFYPEIDLALLANYELDELWELYVREGYDDSQF